jgi:transglutaminase/protease-like cytokinesis protein 3
MKRNKRILSAILLLFILTGCAANAVDNGSLPAPLESFSTELRESKELEQATNLANEKTSLSVQAPVVNPETVQAKTTQKPDNSAKKIVAQTTKKVVPPAKPKVSSTVQKVEIPTPPAQNVAISATSDTTLAGTQQADTNTVTNVKPAQGIPGLPPINYEVNNYNEYYKAIYSSLKNFDTNTYIRIYNFDEKVYNLHIIDDISTNDYDVDYGLRSVNAVLYTMGDIKVLNIQYQYGFSKDKLIAMRDATDAKAAQIIAQIIKPGMSELAKEKAVHDYVVTHTTYDYDNYLKGTLPLEVFNSYGVLVNGLAVCEGYSKAMLKLLKMSGLEAKSVVGYGIDGTNKIPHAWNMVKINGVYTLVDATWDDPVPDQKNKVYYDYFNISDADMAKDHQWDKTKYPKAAAILMNIQ